MNDYKISYEFDKMHSFSPYINISKFALNLKMIIRTNNKAFTKKKKKVCTKEIILKIIKITYGKFKITQNKHITLLNSKHNFRIIKIDL